MICINWDLNDSEFVQTTTPSGIVKMFVYRIFFDLNSLCRNAVYMDATKTTEFQLGKLFEKIPFMIPFHDFGYNTHECRLCGINLLHPTHAARNAIFKLEIQCQNIAAKFRSQIYPSIHGSSIHFHRSLCFICTLTKKQERQIKQIA